MKAKAKKYFWGINLHFNFPASTVLRPDFVLTEELKPPYEGQFCGKLNREGSCCKAVGGP